MSVAIKPEDARLVIAANARMFADFVEYDKAPGVPQFSAAVKQRYEDLGKYVTAFSESHLSIGDQS